MCKVGIHTVGRRSNLKFSNLRDLTRPLGPDSPRDVPTGDQEFRYFTGTAEGISQSLQNASDRNLPGLAGRTGVELYWHRFGKIHTYT